MGVGCGDYISSIKFKPSHSNLNITITKTALAMKQLQDLGYAENGMGGAVVCKLNYADYADERVIEIRDFDEENLHLYYMAWREEKYLTHCEECGVIVICDNAKAGCQTKYCQPCAKEKFEQSKSNYYYRTKRD